MPLFVDWNQPDYFPGVLDGDIDVSIRTYHYIANTTYAFQQFLAMLNSMTVDDQSFKVLKSQGSHQQVVVPLFVFVAG